MNRRTFGLRLAALLGATTGALGGAAGCGGGGNNSVEKPAQYTSPPAEGPGGLDGKGGGKKKGRGGLDPVAEPQ